MMIYVTTQVNDINSENLNALGVTLEVPSSPFPRYSKDEAIKLTGTKAFEKPLGKIAKSQFFWVTGLMRENYDLIYPYLNQDGSKRSIKDFTSKEIFNYDLCAQSKNSDGSLGDAYEVLSGAIREWLYEPIIERLIDNRILKEKPVFENGDIQNIDKLEGYGPFLAAAAAKNDKGESLFPPTFGGGIGIERCLFALLNGDKIKKVEDITFFGKNPDSHPIYLY
jgi:aspartyl/asparaginyl-tRNA synthetase